MNFERVYDLFHRAAELPVAERGPFLERECADDPTTADEVQALLRADGDVGDTFLGSTKAFGALEATLDGGRLPERIGPYRVLRVLGRGGMGVVYAAEQEQPRRHVAVKVIRAGFVTAELLRRFDREATVLGQLQHPGIAHVYEAGTTTVGDEVWPYFAMELIEGQPLDVYVATVCRGTRERLELFARICDAVQHAHERGVVHRDLKPNNILVTKGDVAQPKILDFGVARVTDAKHAATLRTEIGQIIGTVGFMSPEQLAGRSVDTRTDVYALGVVLFHMLSGRLPYAVQGKSLPEIARMIDGEDPTQLSVVSRDYRGDLELIVATALERDPERRYPSAAAIAADVRRHLASEPIAARAPSTWYRTSKFVRRHRALVGGAAATFTALTIGLVAATTAFLQASREREAALAATSFLAEMLENADPGQTGEEITLRKMLDDAAPHVRERFAAQPEVEASLQLTIARTYAALAQYDTAEAHASRAHELLRERWGADDERAVEARGVVGAINASRGRNEAAQADLEAVVAQQRATLAPDDPRRLEPLHLLAGVASAQSRFDAARPLFEEAARLERVTAPELDTSLALYGTYAALELRTGHPERALELVDRVLPRAVEKYGVKRPSVTSLLAFKGILLRALDRHQEAVEVGRQAYGASLEVYGPEHHLTMENAQFLSSALIAANHDPDAVPVNLLSLSAVLMRAGKLAEAEAGVRELLDGRFPAVSANPNMAYHVHMTLVDVLTRRGKYAEAVEVATPALAHVVETVGEGNPRYARLGILKAEALIGAGEVAEAERFLTRLQEVSEGRLRDQVTEKLTEVRARRAAP